MSGRFIERFNTTAPEIMSCPTWGWARPTTCELRVVPLENGESCAVLTDIPSNEGVDIPDAARHLHQALRLHPLHPSRLLRHRNVESLPVTLSDQSREPKSDIWDEIEVRPGFVSARRIPEDQLDDFLLKPRGLSNTTNPTA